MLMKKVLFINSEIQIKEQTQINAAVVTESHENGSGDGGSRHVCIIAVFLLVRLLYLLIHSLNYLFKSIQTLVMLTNLINLVAVPSLITCYSSNSLLKSTLSH